MSSNQSRRSGRVLGRTICRRSAHKQCFDHNIPMYTSLPKKGHNIYRVAQKVALFVRLITYSNIDQFSNPFNCQNQEKICNNTVTKDPASPQVCRHTTLWNVSVLKATTESKTTSVTTHLKSASSSSKADTLNIWCKNCRIWQLLWTITETINTLLPVVICTS